MLALARPRLGVDESEPCQGYSCLGAFPDVFVAVRGHSHTGIPP